MGPFWRFEIPFCCKLSKNPRATLWSHRKICKKTSHKAEKSGEKALQTCCPNFTFRQEREQVLVWPVLFRAPLAQLRGQGEPQCLRQSESPRSAQLHQRQHQQ